MCQHRWVFNISTKAWVVCQACGAKFLVPTELTGRTYHGPIPEKYQNRKESNATQEG
jgi:hypothetical protein